jgi:hypothetical protein
VIPYQAAWVAASHECRKVPLIGCGGLQELRNQVYHLTFDRATKTQVGFLRDIFGNPFRPAGIDPAWLAWRDGTVFRLGQTIYEDCRFDLLPILADALQESGCTNADILQHCHASGPHVRGCWVVDLLLGKV